MSSSIWNSALNILARREHSRAELATKLMRKYPEDPAAVEEVLDRLVVQGLQSDERFMEMWIRSQLNKGRGPIRIQGEARQKGIGPQTELYLQTLDFDWFESALQIAQRKFGASVEFEQQAKVYRFLAYRGFQSDAIRYVLDTLSRQS